MARNHIASLLTVLVAIGQLSHESPIQRCGEFVVMIMSSIPAMAYGTYARRN
jgi:hypothetical protein